MTGSAVFPDNSDRQFTTVRTPLPRNFPRNTFNNLADLIWPDAISSGLQILERAFFCFFGCLFLPRRTTRAGGIWVYFRVQFLLLSCSAWLRRFAASASFFAFGQIALYPLTFLQGLLAPFWEMLRNPFFSWFLSFLHASSSQYVFFVVRVLASSCFFFHIGSCC